jgi:hypothetical protein
MFKVKKATMTYHSKGLIGNSAIFLLSLLLFVTVIFSSCEKDITIDLPPSAEQFVVEGHIETGQPPYVILTRSSDYYATFYLDSLNNYFVHNAIVKVWNGTDTIQLTEFNLDTAGVAVSAYVGLGMVGEEGKIYSLSVDAEGNTLLQLPLFQNHFPLIPSGTSRVWFPAMIRL